jgi:hypothetical protein
MVMNQLSDCQLLKKDTFTGLVRAWNEGVFPGFPFRTEGKYGKLASVTPELKF